MLRGKKAAASCGETAEVLVFEAVLAEELKQPGAEGGKLLPVFFIDCNGLLVGERYTLSVGEVRADKAAGGIKADTSAGANNEFIYAVIRGYLFVQLHLPADAAV